MSRRDQCVREEGLAWPRDAQWATHVPQEPGRQAGVSCAPVPCLSWMPGDSGHQGVEYTKGIVGCLLSPHMEPADDSRPVVTVSVLCLRPVQWGECGISLLSHHISTRELWDLWGSDFWVGVPRCTDLSLEE